MRALTLAAHTHPRTSSSVIVASPVGVRAPAPGASVKAVQRMLGHASAAMALDTYAGLFDADLDEVADRLDRARSAGSGHDADSVRTEMPDSDSPASKEALTWAFVVRRQGLEPRTR